ncbi:hypothetical protein DSECCO2_571160 [anaerobic digester metagenome]
MHDGNGEALAHGEELAAKGGARGGVQGGKGLVEQKRLGPSRQGLAQGPALPLAAGHGPGPAAGQVGDAEEFEEMRAKGRIRRGVGHVLRKGHVREKRIFLEDEPYPAPPGAYARAGRGVAPDLVAQGDAAGVGVVQARQHAQHRGLARARRPGHGQELAGRTGKLHIQGEMGELFFEARRKDHAAPAPFSAMAASSRAASTGTVICGQWPLLSSCIVNPSPLARSVMATSMGLGFSRQRT